MSDEKAEVAALIAATEQEVEAATDPAARWWFGTRLNAYRKLQEHIQQEED